MSVDKVRVSNTTLATEVPLPPRCAAGAEAACRLPGPPGLLPRGLGALALETSQKLLLFPEGLHRLGSPACGVMHTLMSPGEGWWPQCHRAGEGPGGGAARQGWEP